MSFSLDLSKAVKNIKEDKEKVVRRSLLSLSSKIIYATPVGNPSLWKGKAPKGYVGGTLRGAWNASIGTPDRTMRNSKDKNGSKTVSMTAKVADALEMGNTFYLTNPQPYAMAVEYGWSSQARNPDGMVRVNLAAAQRILDQVAN